MSYAWIQILFVRDDRIGDAAVDIFTHYSVQWQILQKTRSSYRDL